MLATSGLGGIRDELGADGDGVGEGVRERVVGGGELGGVMETAGVEHRVRAVGAGVVRVVRVVDGAADQQHPVALTGEAAVCRLTT
ncbi:hypothetical protein [Kitasatospora sp. MBT66]|uniref:hypothetical protein n=1 Tax=Kitasatospora sp. MBT66 TaxID=1444769 RepID=UPI0007C785E7|nr:hypothetical protein [Kitasatospora sp. MBT66]